jgi:hypothetical protein
MLEPSTPNFNTPLHKTTTNLPHLVAKVFKSLNWGVAREIKFKGWVQTHGFSHSINSFTIIIHTYAFASMPLEVFILLREIVEFYKEDARDARELFAILLHSACHVIVFDMLIKVFASNSMLEQLIMFLLVLRMLELKLILCLAISC